MPWNLADYPVWYETTSQHVDDMNDELWRMMDADQQCRKRPRFGEVTRRKRCALVSCWKALGNNVHWKLRIPSTWGFVVGVTSDWCSCALLRTLVEPCLWTNNVLSLVFHVCQRWTSTIQSIIPVGKYIYGVALNKLVPKVDSWRLHYLKTKTQYISYRFL